MSFSINMVDLFGSNFNFTTFGHAKFHTLFGLVMSIICYALIITFIAVFGTDLFLRLNPKIISEQIRPVNYTSILMDPSKFTYAWRIEDSTGQIFNHEGIFRISIEYLHYIKNETGGVSVARKEIVEAEKCSHSNVKDKSFFQDNKINQWYCVNFQKQNLSLGGFFDGNFVKYMRIIVKYCGEDFATNKTSCLSLDKLKKVLLTGNPLYFSVLYPEFYFDPNDLANPLHYQYKNFFNQLDPYLLKVDRIFFKSIFLDDDQNIVINEYIQSNQTAFDRLWQDLAIKFPTDYENPSSNYLYANLIYFSKGSDKYTRRYMKLQDLAATVGGFMQIILVIGKLVCSQINSYQRNLSIINKIFTYELKENEDSKMLSLTNLSKDNLSETPLEKKEDTILKLDKCSRSWLYHDNQEEESSGRKPKILCKNEKGKQFNLYEKGKEDNNFSPPTSLSPISHKLYMRKSQQNLFRLNKADLMNNITLVERKNIELEMLSSEKEKEIQLKLENLENDRLQKEKFALGCSILMKKFCCRSSLKKTSEGRIVKVYETAVSYLQDKLDIVSYMNLISNFDKFQFFEFNECQKYAFHLMNKPNLADPKSFELYDLNILEDLKSQGIDNIKTLTSPKKQAKSYEQKLKVVKYFIKRLKDKTCNIKDEKVFDFLDNEIKSLIIDETNLYK